MATGGMGDLLAGIIASLVGQGVTIFDAAILSASIHNQAGDKAKSHGAPGMLPSDLLPIIRGFDKMKVIDHMEKNLSDELETQKFGAKGGAAHVPGTSITLEGQIGAGKTTFARGIFTLS